jgi:hypothetical protein
MQRKRRLPPEPDAVRDSAGPAFAGADAGQIALEFGNAAERPEHETARNPL